ncbi:MAG: hypothetical protein FWG72_00135 [Oscillospiraceae bacterium]|nr:hypothetical protein [Oscillospiraceae bacterium]
MGLFKPAWQKGDYKQAMAYVETMTNQKKLEEVIESNYSKYTSFVAAKKITNKELAQPVFFQIACEWAFDDAIQLEAINRITDQKLLLKVITEGRAIHPMKIAAVNKLTDHAALTELANKKEYTLEDMAKIAKTKLQQLNNVTTSKQPQTGTYKPCTVCGKTQADFDDYYGSLIGIVIISKDRVVMCGSCNGSVCTICLHKNNGVCPSCKKSM